MKIWLIEWSKWNRKNAAPVVVLVCVCVWLVFFFNIFSVTVESIAKQSNTQNAEKWNFAARDHTWSQGPSQTSFELTTKPDWLGNHYILCPYQTNRYILWFQSAFHFYRHEPLGGQAFGRIFFGLCFFSSFFSLKIETDPNPNECEGISSVGPSRRHLIIYYIYVIHGILSGQLPSIHSSSNNKPNIP